MPGPLRKSSWWNQNPNLSTLLWKFRESQATDSRDRVFALLGIASDKPFRSDYSKSEMIIVKDVFEYLCRDNFPVNSMRTSSIEELQNTVPSLVYMGLDQFVPPGNHMDVMKQFRYRHNKQVFLSEAAVGYLWHINSPLKEQLTHESGIVQVVVGQISAKNIPTRSTESLSTYLEQERGQNTIQGVQIPTQENGFDFEYMMLESGRDDIQLSKILALEAARNGSNVFERFLHNNGEQVVLSSDVIAAADNRGLNILDLLLHKRYDQVRITDALMVDAIQRGPETLWMLLNRYRDQAKMTQTTPSETLKLLLEAYREPLVIRQTAAEAACHHGAHTFKALLDARINQLEIDGAIIDAAFGKGVHEFELLINRYGDRITCTNEMIIKAIGRWSFSCLRTLLNRYGDQIICTNEMIYAAIDHEHFDAFKALLDRYGDQITCTNEMIIKAIGHWSFSWLETLLDRYGDQIICTDEMVYVAMNHKTYLALKALFDKCGDQIDINRIATRAFYHCSNPKNLDFLLVRYGDRLKVSADVLDDMLRFGKENNVRMLLNRCGHRDDVLKALIQIEDNRAFRWYAAQMLVVKGMMNPSPWLKFLASTLGDGLAQRFRPFAILVGGEFHELNELLLDPSLFL